MRFFLGFKLESGIDGELPVLSSQKNVWMYDVAPERMGSAVPASYVNPLNDHAFEQMIEMLRLWQGGNSNAVRMTQIAARNYTYLGFVVMNEEDVRLLKSALADRAHVSLDQDISTRDGVLYRITSGVEKHFANDPSDEDELREIRKTIPIMFEVLDSNSGHPCDRMNVLYMDGHVENTPFGSKFPATQTFVDEFRPPKL